MYANVDECLSHSFYKLSTTKPFSRLQQKKKAYAIVLKTASYPKYMLCISECTRELLGCLSSAIGMSVMKHSSCGSTDTSEETVE